MRGAIRRGDQPGAAAHAFGEVFGAEIEYVVGRLVPGDELRRAEGGVALAEAQKRVHVVRFAAHRLDPSLQHGAVDVAGEHGAAVAAGDAPEHAVEQRPAVVGAKAGGAFQQFRQFPRDLECGARDGVARRLLADRGEQVVAGAIHLPGQRVRCDAVLQQRPALLAPVGEAAGEAHQAHHHSAICAGVSLSARRSVADSKPSLRGR